MALTSNKVSVCALCNDNWQGYVHAWIYANEVTWMEKTCASPFWTGMTLFNVETRHNASGTRKKHMMHDVLFASKGRVAYKGQLFSAPMDWPTVCQQLNDIGDRFVF